MKLPILALLGTSLYLFGTTYRDAPAVNEEARIENVAGDWRMPESRSMYNPGEYLFQIGHSYLMGGLALDEEGLLEAESYDIESELERMVLGQELLLESLAYRPGNAHVWTALAWMRSADFDFDATSEAMQMSWQQAPAHSQLSIERLMLVEAIASLEEEDVMQKFLDANKASIKTDIEVARVYQARQLRDVLQFGTYLAPLVESIAPKDETPK